MMAKTAVIKMTYQKFAKIAEPYICIKNEKQHKKVLAFIEELLQDAHDDDHDPINGLIELISHAITHYEEGLEELKHFEKGATKGPADLAMLRLLIDQHGLGVSDFPEIGDKSLISKILSTERNLTKRHIQKLSKRFKVSPALFF
ncbi:MAG: transcriptional regulator [Gammaproteobacteria bacterium]|nr:transcriptional regulator [Gammaproteobacteria bacterium]